MAEPVDDKTHAVLSPSGAHRWARCPGSPVLEAQVPGDNSSVHARWGTCAHEVAGTILFWAVGQSEAGEVWAPENAEGYIGRVFQIEGHEVEFDHEMADCVNDYVAHVESYWEPGDILIVEQAVPLEQITGEKDATGTSDCIIIKPAAKRIVVIDLKGGKGVMVDAEDNEQGLMYASGAIHEHELLYGPFDEVLIVIVQPRLQHVSEWLLDIVEFDARIGTLMVEAATCDNLLRGALDLDGYLVPGEKQCRFCKAKSICPALKGEVSSALALTAPPARADEFPDLSLPKQAAAAVPEEMTVVTPEQLASAWKAIPIIEQWIGAVREAVHAQLHDGLEIGDLCLYESKQGNRAWANPETVEERLKKGRVKVEEMYVRKLISPTAAEKLAKAGTIPKKVWADIAAQITRPDGKPVVGVRGDEKRLEWHPARPEEFPDLSLESQAEDPLFA